MKALSLASLLVVLHVYGQERRCDESADVLFVQDLQNTMHRSLEEIEDDVEDIMDELQDVFRHPRFGVVTFKEVNGIGCVDMPVPFTWNEDIVEKVYERLQAVQKPTTQGYGSPLSGLLAALTWSEIQWTSAHRIILLLTNNMPTPFDNAKSASAEQVSGCYRYVQSPQEAVLINQIKQTGTTILFVIPRAANAVTSYWRRFNTMLGQHSSLLTTSSHDLDDWFEEKEHFFKVLKAQNCSKKSDQVPTLSVNTTMPQTST